MDGGNDGKSGDEAGEDTNTGKQRLLPARSGSTPFHKSVKHRFLLLLSELFSPEMTKWQILNSLSVQTWRGGALGFWGVACRASVDHCKRKVFGEVTWRNEDISEPGEFAVAVERVGCKVQRLQVLPLDQVPGQMTIKKGNRTGCQLPLHTGKVLTSKQIVQNLSSCVHPRSARWTVRRPVRGRRAPDWRERLGEPERLSQARFERSWKRGCVFLK